MLEVNPPIADGFMKVSDIRRDVRITNKFDNRTIDYDQVGTVRVGKLLKLPTLTSWKKDALTDMRKEEDAWVLAVNDQELARGVARNNNKGSKFEDAYKMHFKEKS